MNRLLRLLKIKYPIIQAPMAGGVVSPEMIAAVTKAGGLGSLPLGYLDAHATQAAIKKTSAISGPFSVNVFIPAKSQTPTENQVNQMLSHVNHYRQKLGLPSLNELSPLQETPAEELIDIAVHAGVRIVSFTFGTLSQDKIRELHSKGVTVIGTATSVNEGLLLESFGCDAVIAQGSEAGGHRGGGFLDNEPGGMIGTLALVPQMVDALQIPVIAAGGIMDGRGLAAALTLGAEAAQLGTAFLACKESTASDLHKSLLKKADTVITSVFTGKQVRSINNNFVTDTEKKFSKEGVLPYPLQHQLTTEFRKEANKTKQPQWASFWSGQGGAMSRSLTTSELMRNLIREMHDALPHHALKI